MDGFCGIGDLGSFFWAMKISTKTRYALRFLVDLAMHEQAGFVSLPDIANRQEVSKKYFESIVSKLKQCGFVVTTRGYMGGYRLARPASEITLGEVMRLTEDEFEMVHCLKSPNPCSRGGSCATLAFWHQFQDRINSYLDSVTLQDVVDLQRGGDSCDRMFS